MSHHQVIQGGWIEWAKKDLSECLDLEELEKLFHAEDDKKAGGKKTVNCWLSFQLIITDLLLQACGLLWSLGLEQGNKFTAMTYI